MNDDSLLAELNVQEGELGVKAILALATFTLRQVGESQREVGGIPTPEPKRVARKNHKTLGFPWNRQAMLF